MLQVLFHSCRSKALRAGLLEADTAPCKVAVRLTEVAHAAVCIRQLRSSSIGAALRHAAHRHIAACRLSAAWPAASDTKKPKVFMCLFAGRLVSVRGTVVRVSGIRPLVVQMDFACSKCGTATSCSFPDGKFTPPQARCRASVVLLQPVPGCIPTGAWLARHAHMQWFPCWT